MEQELTLSLVLLYTEQVTNGVTANGNPWRRQNIIAETAGTNYPRKICLTLLNDRVGLWDNILTPGAKITATFTLESREFNGRWYTDARALNIVATAGLQASQSNSATLQAAPATQGQPMTHTPPAGVAGGNGGASSLPF